LTKHDRVVITGMSINTPLGDTLDAYLEGLLAGRSAISRWKVFQADNTLSKIGGDLSEYDTKAKLARLEGKLPPEIYRRLRKLIGRVAWSTGLSLLMAADAWLDAGFDERIDLERVAIVVAGHNINQRYNFDNRVQFAEEPDFIDGMMALLGLDTDHAGSISEVLQARGPIYTVGAACASGNAALRCAVDEVMHHDCEAALVVGAVLDFAPTDVHAMALMGAITYQSFNDKPTQGSRPYDTRREGFVPSHGGGVLVVEKLSSALKRGAKIWAEVLAVEANSDGNHLPQPSAEGQARLMRRVLARAGLAPEQIDYINAHATSTPLGDITELSSIRNVFGDHAKKLKINATKSMLGHTCWAAPTVESIAAILQMRAGKLHPSINIEEPDPALDLDVCRWGAIECQVQYLMKNSFGFGGINCVSIFGRPDASISR
jgi:3-oxoacyl-(acyl-carrier-protein) synthase